MAFGKAELLRLAPKMDKSREGLSMTRIRALILTVIGAPVMALAVTTGTASATPQSATAQPFHATFVDI
jgi:hypothetical protein